MPAAVTKPELSLRNTLQNLRVEFGDLIGLPREQRRIELLKRCQDVYDKALDKESLGRAGPFSNPDCSAANKVIETVAKLSEVWESDGKPGGGGEGEPAQPSVSAIMKAADELEQRRVKAA